MIFNYEIAGCGWADVEIEAGGKKFYFRLSYIGEDLDDLLNGLVDILRIKEFINNDDDDNMDSYNGSFIWNLDGEGKEAEVVFNTSDWSSYKGLIQIKAIKKNLNRDITVINTWVNAHELVSDIVYCCSKILRETGIIGYSKTWGTATYHPFPIACYLMLKSYLSGKKCIRYDGFKNLPNDIALPKSSYEDELEILKEALEEDVPRKIFNRKNMNKIRTVHLKPIYNSFSLGHSLTFLSCSLDYQKIPNLLFVDGKYDNKDEDDFYKLHASEPQNYVFVILETEPEVIRINNRTMNYTHALRIKEDKYLFTCCRFEDNEGNDYDNNCEIFNKNLELKSTFGVGTYFYEVQMNMRNELWFNYEDIAIFGNYEPAKSGLCGYYPSGLNFYEFKDENHAIYDCYSINLVSDNTIWANYQSESNCDHIARIVNGFVDKYFISPRYCIYHFAVKESENETLILTCNDNKLFTLYNTRLSKSKRLDRIARFQFRDEDNNILEPCHAQGQTILFWKDCKLYQATIDFLLEGFNDNRSVF